MSVFSREKKYFKEKRTCERTRRLYGNRKKLFFLVLFCKSDPFSAVSFRALNYLITFYIVDYVI